MEVISPKQDYKRLSQIQFNLMTITKPRAPRKHGIPEKAFDALQAGIQSILDDKDWAGFLTSINKIHDYSFNNRMLIMFTQMQRKYGLSPWVAGRRTWETKFNRKLLPGEFKKPIWILAPTIVEDPEKEKKVLIGFHGTKVYDVNQTEGDPLPEPDTSDMMSQIEGEANPDIFTGLCAVAANRNPKVTVLDAIPEAEMGEAHGRCWFTGKDGTASKIELKAGLTLASKISVMSHELGHAILHSDDEYRIHTPGSIKELEAESVAFMVCSHYGIDVGNRSFKYIVHHNRATDEIVQEVTRAGTRILKAYEEIVQIVDTFLEVK